MKLHAIRAHKGVLLPGLGKSNGLNLNTMTKDAEESIYRHGWRLHLRGPLLMFESPPGEEGKRLVYLRPVAEFDLGFEFDEGETIENFQRWDSHPAEQKAVKK